MSLGVNFYVLLATAGKGFFRIRTTVCILNTQCKFYVAIFEDAIRQAGEDSLETTVSFTNLCVAWSPPEKQLGETTPNKRFEAPLPIGLGTGDQFLHPRAVF